MKTIITVHAVIFAVILGIFIYIGLDPKKWRTWVLSLYSFLTLFLTEIVGTGNFYISLKIATGVTFAIIFGGIITYRNKERAKRWLGEDNNNEE